MNVQSTTTTPALSNMEGLTSQQPRPLWALRLEVHGMGSVGTLSVIGNQWPSARRAVTFQLDAPDAYASVPLTPFVDDVDW